jgi:hypothetical protein
MNLEFTMEKIPIPHTVLQNCLSELRKEIVKAGMLSGVLHHTAKKPSSMQSWAGFPDPLLICHA